MPEGITAESLMENIKESLSDSVSKSKSFPLFEEEKLSSKINRLFGRPKLVHHILGGGKSADVLVWRDKKISASSIVAATVIWVIFEWLNYNFLTILCFVLVLGMLAQFVGKNAAGILNRSPSNVPRLYVPEEVFVNIANLIGAQVVASFWAAAIIGSLFNFLTVLYVGERS